MITILLFCLLQLIPVPVEYTPGDGVCIRENISVKHPGCSFKRTAASLKPFQKQEAYMLAIRPESIVIENGDTILP